MIDLIFPRLDQGMTQGYLLEWMVSVGDTVGKGDAVATIETDKVTTELEAPVSGVIAEILVDAGNDVEVGRVIARIVPS